jgi:hypothetical protein
MLLIPSDQQGSRIVGSNAEGRAMQRSTYSILTTHAAAGLVVVNGCGLR